MSKNSWCLNCDDWQLKQAFCLIVFRLVLATLDAHFFAFIALIALLSFLLHSFIHSIKKTHISWRLRIMTSLPEGEPNWVVVHNQSLASLNCVCVHVMGGQLTKPEQWRTQGTGGGCGYDLNTHAREISFYGSVGVSVIFFAEFHHPPTPLWAESLCLSICFCGKL